MALNFLRPGVPGMQPVGDLRTAKSAILFGAINGLFLPPVLELCLCTDGGRPCDDDDAEQRYYQLANFVLAMLGVALLFVDMALSRAAVLASPLWPPMLRWMVWLTKALTCGTLQFGVNLVYFCLKMLCARFMLVFS